jgi:hypothetical protein
MKTALVNPWLGSLVSFLPIIAFLGVVALCLRVRCGTENGPGRQPAPPPEPGQR